MPGYKKWVAVKPTATHFFKLIAPTSCRDNVLLMLSYPKPFSQVTSSSLLFPSLV